LIIKFSRVSNFAQTPLSFGRMIAPGGALFGWERSMTKADEFREYAEEALRWSRESKTEEEKKALIDLAINWMQAAELSERDSDGQLRMS